MLMLMLMSREWCDVENLKPINCLNRLYSYVTKRPELTLFVVFILNVYTALADTIKVSLYA